MAMTVKASAQVEAGHFSVMPMVGFVASNLTGIEDRVYQYGSSKLEVGSAFRPGFLVGVEGGYQLSSRVGLTAGFVYSLQGYENGSSMSLSDGSYSIEDNSKLSLGYLNVPILVNFYVVKGLAVKAGIQPGFLVSAKYKYDIEGKGYFAGSTKHETVDVKDGCNTVDLSIPVGVSYEFKNGIVIDGRYNIGLTHVVKDTDSRNSVFQISVGYKFGI